MSCVSGILNVANPLPAGFQKSSFSGVSSIFSHPQLQILKNICRFKSFNQYPMKQGKTILFFFLIVMICFGVVSCSVFAPKYGCPSNGKNVGAERILSGEKVPKAPKFKA